MHPPRLRLMGLLSLGYRGVSRENGEVRARKHAELSGCIIGRMRLLTSVLLCALSPIFAQTSDEKDAVAAAQKLFDGMAAHDAAAIRSSGLADAKLFSVREQGEPGAGTPVADFANQIASIKDDLLERFTSPPTVLIRGRMAQVWGEYEFVRNGKFGHCGVDSFSLFKTAEGWKIVTIVYTTETTGCKGH